MPQRLHSQRPPLTGMLRKQIMQIQQLPQSTPYEKQLHNVFVSQNQVIQEKYATTSDPCMMTPKFVRALATARTSSGCFADHWTKNV